MIEALQSILEASTTVHRRLASVRRKLRSIGLLATALVSLAFYTATALASGAAAAAESPAPIPDAEVSRRLSFIEARIERASPSACLWWHAWYYGYMIVTVGQASGGAGDANRGLRIDSGVGAAFASLGVLGLGVVDFPPLHTAATLRGLPARTPAERSRKLASRRGAARRGRPLRGGRPLVGGPRRRRRGDTHLEPGARARLQRIASSIVTLVSGVGITEAQIFTPADRRDRRLARLSARRLGQHYAGHRPADDLERGRAPRRGRAGRCILNADDPSWAANRAVWAPTRAVWAAKPVMRQAAAVVPLSLPLIGGGAPRLLPRRTKPLRGGVGRLKRQALPPEALWWSP